MKIIKSLPYRKDAFDLINLVTHHGSTCVFTVCNSQIKHKVHLFRSHGKYKLLYTRDVEACIDYTTQVDDMNSLQHILTNGLNENTTVMKSNEAIQHVYDVQLISLISRFCINNDQSTFLLTAKRISFDLNPDVKPCDNFYQFACGNFMTGRVNGRLSRLGMMEFKIEEQIWRLLEKEPKRSEPKIFKSVKRFFQMCMDEKKMDGRGAAPGLAMLKKLGGWPVLGNWDPSKWSILETAIQSWHLGLDGFNLMYIGIEVDLTDHTNHVFKVEQPEWPIPNEYLIQGEDNSVVKEYFQYMVDMAVLFGADKQTAEDPMRKVLQLQIELAKVLEPDDEQQEIQKQLKQFTLKELDEDPNRLMDWRKLFEGIATPIKLQDNQKIDFYVPEAIKKTFALINRYSDEIVANHVMWSFAMKMSPYLTTEMRDRYQRLEQVLNGRIGRIDRWRECMVEMKGFGVALSAIYVNNFFDKSSRNKAIDITNLIQTEMDNVLLEADWMDEKTRQTAQQKSAKMAHVVGYPDELVDMTKVENHYKELKLNEEHFFEARLDLNIFLKEGDLNKLKEGAVNRPWEAYAMYTAKANAHYVMTTNSIEVEAGILQEPFFSALVPSYLNYASIGFIIGHEMTHAFDDQGREFDDEGELTNWWDEASLNKFNEKKQCFIDQYSSFIESITKRKVNGVSTLGENIADNGGLKLAYRAYRRVADNLKKPEPGLPGLKQYSNNQLFFINFANSWCAAMPFERMEYDLLTNEHAPSEWRVNGAVMNMPEFGKLFGCAKGTPMNPNPADRCEVW